MSMNKQEYWRLQVAAELSNSQAAAMLGVTKRAVEKWRSGENKAPKAVMMSLRYYIKYGELSDEQS